LDKNENAWQDNCQAFSIDIPLLVQSFNQLAESLHCLRQFGRIDQFKYILRRVGNIMLQFGKFFSS
jgi:hypothetical protein